MPFIDLRISYVNRPDRPLWCAIERLDGWFWSFDAEQWSRGLSAETQAPLDAHITNPGYYARSFEIYQPPTGVDMCIYILGRADGAGTSLHVVDVYAIGRDDGEPIHAGPAARRAEQQRQRYAAEPWGNPTIAVEATQMGDYYRRGKKFTDGREIDAQFRYWFYGDDECTLYTATLWTDGRASCNCPRWTHNPARVCPHTEIALTLTADRNDTDELVIRKRANTDLSTRSRGIEVDE